MDQELSISRFPPSTDRSLRAWSTADIHILNLLEKSLVQTSSIAILNDRFGYLTTQLSSHQPLVITHYKSQEDAIQYNLDANKLNPVTLNQKRLLDDTSEMCDFIIMKVPKTMELFHLFLSKAHSISKKSTKVYCGFMTRHFTKQIVELASIYFEDVSQSLAWKKSRVLSLSQPKPNIHQFTFLRDITYLNHRGDTHIFKQYFGVFSANHIDYATQFLLKLLTVPENIHRALDLASGNGVIAHEIRQQSEDIEIHLMDDAHLAVESSKLNLTGVNNHFHYNYTLNHFDDHFFDLVVCNPPFHFEHENTIEIALNLFRGVSRILKENGSFILVANIHLNYRTHLSKYFDTVKAVNMNSKFEVIECTNTQ